MAKTNKSYLIQISQGDLENLIFEAVLRAIKIQKKSIIPVDEKAKSTSKTDKKQEVHHG